MVHWEYAVGLGQALAFASSEMGSASTGFVAKERHIQF